MTKRAKALLQPHRAVAPAKITPQSAPSTTKKPAHSGDWSGNQSHLQKLASPALDSQQESHVAARHKSIEVLPPEDHHHPDTAKNKDTIRSFGSKANTLLAVAMEENKTVSSDYPFGDVYPSLTGPGQPKTGDAANFGLYKMNWLMISQTEKGKSMIKEERDRQAKEVHDNGQGVAPTDWNIESAVGHQINASTAIATEIMVEAMKKWHAEIAPDPSHPIKGNFWAGHRAGWTGLNDPGAADWDDILFYYDAVMAIKARLDNDNEGKLTTGSSRIGVKVHNI